MSKDSREENDAEYPLEERDPVAVAQWLADHALQGVQAAMPYLAGLVSKVRIQVDARAETACVFPSGRILVHPDWFSSLSLHAATFVIAHEIMHLMLDSHSRAEDADAELFNIAHDFIINDMLREELGVAIPAGGLKMRGASDMAAEKLVADLRDTRERREPLLHNRSIVAYPRPPHELLENADFGGALAAALRPLAPEEPPTAQPTGPLPPRPEIILNRDALSEAKERAWFPGESADRIKVEILDIKAAALEALEVHQLQERYTELFDHTPGVDPGYYGAMVTALKTHYRPPWELALQRWMEATAPGPRSYARPSRRGADRTDIVLPGYKREGWTVHIVLDTSGSMTENQARVLGMIGSFCEGMGVEEARIVQCDTRVTRDDHVRPEELQSFALGGFGGSDMSPAMYYLAEDPEVEAVIVLTDGDISYPSMAMPYQVLWAICEVTKFTPPYGCVLPCPPTVGR